MASQRLSLPPANHFNGVILISLLKLTYKFDKLSFLTLVPTFYPNILCKKVSKNGNVAKILLITCTA